LTLQFSEAYATLPRRIPTERIHFSGDGSFP